MSVPVEHVHQQPVLTAPYEEPDRHWKTVSGVTTDEIVDKRRGADEPLPMGWRRPEQRELDLDGGASGVPGIVDQLRTEVRQWRQKGWPGTTNATRELLEYWAREPGEGPVFSLFYAQREAVETVVYLTEAASGNHWMVKRLSALAEGWSKGLLRLALRMATGTGKTTVMACLIAWYAVNRRREHRTDTRGLARNVDRIVVICPGRTIMDRLQGLNPRVARNIYDEWRLVPKKLRRRLSDCPVTILNWEKLQPRTGVAFSELEVKAKKGWLSRLKAIDLAAGSEIHEMRETFDDMWSRLLGSSSIRSLERKERIVVLNDEGHHCWQRKDGEKPGVWMESLHALRVHGRFQLIQAVDLSATPIFINPAMTKVPEGAEQLRSPILVPWVVSEFALMESMESGLVKIPQPPRRDSTSKEPNESSPLRNLFEANGGVKLTTTGGMALVRQGADILYQDYVDTFNAWASVNDPRVGHPVLIAVANNKVNARAIFDMFGGRRGPDGVLEKSEFDLLSNVPRNGADITECGMRTILVLSKTNNPETRESEEIAGGALGLREVGKNADASEEQLREVLQTVAQPGQAGEEVRCVVSVGMLTEGWDCQRVTHILGYRKFGSQLLCEQTMGRSLRRRDYENLEEVKRRDSGDVDRRFPAEYATVFGVPFDRQAGVRRQPPQPPGAKTQVYPVAERKKSCRIWVPDFSGYTVSTPGVGVHLDPDRVVEVWPVDGQEGQEIRWVEAGGPIGDKKFLVRTIEEHPGSGAWRLAAELVRLLNERDEGHSNGDEGAGRIRRGVLFGECLKVVYEWLDHPKIAIIESDLRGDDDGMRDLARSAILDALDIRGKPVQKTGVPSEPSEEHRSAADWQPFTTGLKVIVPVEKSELNVAACHTKLEGAIARALEALPHVAAFVRNHGPERIEVPYRYKGGWAKYVPDFFVRCQSQCNQPTTHILLEGKGRPDERSEHKGWWTENWWIPCANAAGVNEEQIWIRREIGSANEVAEAIETAIREVTGS